VAVGCTVALVFSTNLGVVGAEVGGFVVITIVIFRCHSDFQILPTARPKSSRTWDAPNLERTSLSLDDLSV
jgi:hypothetical protein